MMKCKFLAVTACVTVFMLVGYSILSSYMKWQIKAWGKEIEDEWEAQSTKSDDIVSLSMIWNPLPADGVKERDPKDHEKWPYEYNVKWRV